MQRLLSFLKDQIVVKREAWQMEDDTHWRFYSNTSIARRLRGPPPLSDGNVICEFEFLEKNCRKIFQEQFFAKQKKTHTPI